jgi:hypothetical protein
MKKKADASQKNVIVGQKKVSRKKNNTAAKTRLPNIQKSFWIFTYQRFFILILFELSKSNNKTIAILD